MATAPAVPRPHEGAAQSAAPAAPARTRHSRFPSKNHALLVTTEFQLVQSIAPPSGTLRLHHHGWPAAQSMATATAAAAMRLATPAVADTLLEVAGLACSVGGTVVAGMAAGSGAGAASVPYAPAVPALPSASASSLEERSSSRQAQGGASAQSRARMRGLPPPAPCCRAAASVACCCRWPGAPAPGRPDQRSMRAAAAVVRRMGCCSSPGNGVVHWLQVSQHEAVQGLVLARGRDRYRKHGAAARAAQACGSAAKLTTTWSKPGGCCIQAARLGLKPGQTACREPAHAFCGRGLHGATGARTAWPPRGAPAPPWRWQLHQLLGLQLWRLLGAAHARSAPASPAGRRSAALHRAGGRWATARAVTAEIAGPAQSSRVPCGCGRAARPTRPHAHQRMPAAPAPQRLCTSSRRPPKLTEGAWKVGGSNGELQHQRHEGLACVDVDAGDTTSTLHGGRWADGCDAAGEPRNNWRRATRAGCRAGSRVHGRTRHSAGDGPDLCWPRRCAAAQIACKLPCHLSHGPGADCGGWFVTLPELQPVLPTHTRGA